MNTKDQSKSYTVTTYPLWVSEDSTDYGVSRIDVHLDPGPDISLATDKIGKNHSLKVGIYETSPLGAGNQLRLSTWLAAAVLAKEVQRPLIGTRVDIDVTGKIDGPSAGGLLTVALLAAWNKVNIRPKITMTGTILPDGSIGPVGGIPLKIKAAAKEKFEAVIVPDCQHIEEDFESDKIFDIEHVGSENNIKIIFVSDVKEAYQFLTGKKLQEEPQVSNLTIEPSFPIETADSIRETVTRFYAQIRYALEKHNKSVADYKFKDIITSSIFDEAIILINEGLSKTNSEMQIGNWTAAFEFSFDTLTLLRGVKAWASKGFQSDFNLALKPNLKRFHGYLQPLRHKWLKIVDSQFTNIIENSMMKAYIDFSYTYHLQDICCGLEWVQDLTETFGTDIFKKKGFFDRLLEDSEADVDDPQSMAIRAVVNLTFRKVTFPYYATNFFFPKALYPQKEHVVPEISDAVCNAWLKFYSTRNEILYENIVSYLQLYDDNELPNCLQLAYHYFNAAQFLLQSEAQERKEPKDHEKSISGQQDNIGETLNSVAFQTAIGVELAGSLVESQLQLEITQNGEERFGLSRALTKMLEDSRRNANESICRVQAEGSFALAATWNYFIAISKERGKPAEKIEALKAFWLAEGLATLQLLCTSQNKQV